MTRKLQVLSCAGSHHLRPGKTEDYCFAFCTNNGICAHGNEAVDSAIAQGKRAGLISPESARRMNDVVFAARLRLRSTVDVNAEAIKQWRFGDLEPGLREFLFKRIAANIGSDPEQWNENQVKLQLQIARPILAIIRQLKRLGLLLVDEQPKRVAIEKLVKS